MQTNHIDLLRHLTELRKRIIHSLLFLAIISFTLFYFSNQLYTLLALPLLKHLAKGQGLIATSIVSPFFVPFQLAFTVSLFLAIPFFLYQLWAFIAPALYRHERKLIWPLLLLSTVLFYLGMAFAYFVIFPIIFGFLTQSAPKGVLISPDIGQYYDFSVRLLFVFGIIFEVPVVTVLLIQTGIVSREKLIQWRPYVIVGAFVTGMLLAPPDVVSQTLVAIPLWILFEVGILLSRFFQLTQKS